MGLKVRRLKNGFAYYGEYKFADGAGGQRCVYERVEAGSLREAKRIYAARRKELHSQNPKQISKQTPRKRASEKQSGTGDANAVVAALLRTLRARNIISDRDVRELLAGAYTGIDGIDRMAAHERADQFIRDTFSAGVYTPLQVDPAESVSVVPFRKIRSGPHAEVGAEFAGQIGTEHAYRVRLVAE